MSKVVARITIPIGSPDKLILLGNLMAERHKKLGDKSPLETFDMITFSERLKVAKEKREMAKKLMTQAEILMQEANIAMGIDKTQNSKTEGTVINTIYRVRDFLKSLNRGKEEVLSEWGFKVVINVVKRSKKKKQG